MRVLVIDDEPRFFGILSKHLPEIEFHWLPAVQFAVALMEDELVKFDLVVVDCMGTTYDFERELGMLKGEIWLTSATMKPTDSDLPFVVKDDLVKTLKDKSVGK